MNYCINILHGILAVQKLEIFQFGLVKRASVRMVPRRPPFWKFDTVDPTSPWFTRSCMKTHEWTFAKVGATVHDNIFEVLIAGSLSCPWQYFRSFDRGIVILSVFMAPARVVLHASRNKSHREVVDMFSRGGRHCHFANTSVEMAKFVRAAVQLRRQCFINPWIQTALFLIIAIAATSAAVSWQFAGWISRISPIPLRLYSTAVDKVWCLQCGQMF